MKSCIKLSITIFCFMVLSQSLYGQMVIKKKVAGGDAGIHMISELGAILTENDEVISVMLVMPEDSRPEGYKKIDIKKADEILIINKKRVKSLKSFEEIYNSMDIDELVKMGVRRDGELMIVEFKKIDPERLPKGRKMMIRTASVGQGEGGMTTKSFTFSSDEGMMEGVEPLMGSGLMVGESDKKVIVKMIMEEQGFGIKKGDEIISINGQKVKSVAQLVKEYGKIKTGEKVELGYKSDGKELTASFEKSEAKGGMRVIKKEHK